MPEVPNQMRALCEATHLAESQLLPPGRPVWRGAMTHTGAAWLQALNALGYEITRKKKDPVEEYVSCLLSAPPVEIGTEQDDMPETTTVRYHDE